MNCRRGGAFGGSRIARFLLVGTSASTAFITGVAPLAAVADNGRGRDHAKNADGHRGKGPRNSLSVQGDTHNHGHQNSTTNTAGGDASVQNALCRRVRTCNITQHITIVDPRATAAPVTAARPASTPSPRPVPTVTVTVTATPIPSRGPSRSPSQSPSQGPAPATALAAPAPCPARPVLGVGGAIGTGPLLLTGLLSLAVSAKGSAC